MAESFDFVVVNGQTNKHLISFVKEILDNFISPIYGPQEKALASILTAADRRCEVLLATSSPATPVPLGLVVYKLQPTDEYSDFEVTNSVEIKTLCLADPSKTSGKGYGSALLKQVLLYANSVAASSTHVTISDIKPDSRLFFEKRGFKELSTLPNPHCNDPERLYSLTLSTAKNGTVPRN